MYMTHAYNLFKHPIFSKKKPPKYIEGGRMFENRIKLDGSAYLAEPYSPTSAHKDRNRHLI